MKINIEKGYITIDKEESEEVIYVNKGSSILKDCREKPFRLFLR